MDNARDEPLMVQLWLDLEKRFGWDRVGVVFASSSVTGCYFNVKGCKAKKKEKIFKIFVSDGVCISSFFSFLLGFFPP